MRNDKIYLHPKLGLNPKLGVCPICHEDNGEIVLPGIKVKEEYPNKMFSSICDSCKGLLGTENVGFFNQTNSDSCILKAEAVKRMFPDKYEEIKGHIVIVDHTFWQQPKEDTENAV